MGKDNPDNRYAPIPDYLEEVMTVPEFERKAKELGFTVVRLTSGKNKGSYHMHDKRGRVCGLYSDWPEPSGFYAPTAEQWQQAARGVRGVVLR